MALSSMPQAGRGIAAGAVAMLALLAALGIAGGRSVVELAASGHAVQQSQAALAALASLQAAAATTADGGQPNAAAGARAAADAQLAQLRSLLAADPAQFSRLVTLGTALAERFDAPVPASVTAEPRRREPPPAADSRRRNDAVQTAVLQLQGPAQAALAGAQQRHAAAANRAALWWWLATAAALLPVAGLAWAAWRLQCALTGARSLAAHAADQQQAHVSNLQHVLTTAPEPICLLDADARIVRANPACLRLWALGADAATGMPFVDTVLPDDRRRTQLALDQLLAGGTTPGFSHRVQRADGSAAVLSWHAHWSPADATLVCAGRDVTELQALRAQAAQQALALQHRDADLAAATAHAEHADAAQARFLATLGSGLCDPLDAVDNLAGVLLQGLSGPLTGAQRRELQQLQGSAQQVRAVVHDMLDIARIDAGALALERAPFDLWEALQQVATAQRPRAQDKGLALQLAVADDLGYARGDALRLQQVLAKLLDNAIRCTASGSITLAAEPLASGMLAISVTDTGCGIGAADIDRLFEPFSQRESRSNDQPRIGLGLAIAQRLARLMGGSIAVASRPGQGSRFTVTLPADAATVSAAG